MDHLQVSRMKVVKYIKNGKISREVGEVALQHVKKFAMQGKSADVDIILEKLGALKAKGDKKKILSVDESSNPYVQKRRHRSKTPLIVGLVVLVVCGIVLIVCLQSSSKDIREHDSELDRKMGISSGANTRDADDITKKLTLPDDPEPAKEKAVKEEPVKEKAVKEEPKVIEAKESKEEQPKK
jgi:hypothetical protein